MHEYNAQTAGVTSTTTTKQHTNSVFVTLTVCHIYIPFGNIFYTAPIHTLIQFTDHRFKRRANQTKVNRIWKCNLMMYNTE